MAEEIDKCLVTDVKEQRGSQQSSSKTSNERTTHCGDHPHPVGGMHHSITTKTRESGGQSKLL